MKLSFARRKDTYARHRIGNIGQILKRICKRIHDEAVVICERAFDQVEAYAASIEDDQTRNGRPRLVDDGRRKCCRE